MFSAFSSTNDPLDYHMIWHYRGILEAVGAFTSDDLHTVDMAFVAQLLSQGLCHWAIYVVLHIPYREDHPYLHVIVIREIMFQYCETWSSIESQRQFIKDLGIPSEWMHEALVTASLKTKLASSLFKRRVAYSKMAEEICDLLVSDLSEEDPNRETQLKCFETALNAPLPEDMRSTHLQDVVTLFSLYLSETGQTSA